MKELTKEQGQAFVHELELFMKSSRFTQMEIIEGFRAKYFKKCEVCGAYGK